ncbi:uncharacterized protein FIBRA_01525 [Fibroporia radiculosa]|uniref:Uncharacterized protein n=1 Tax=Fibroporia radiculosa TaxID=599839 RepID=J4HTH0_9APHY|nr:uncharacterized protein FIBRA_01525 [Fibroporia radiculosa]CCL99507.1 predicted protein [Fibroporia radiculosa]
MARTVEENLLEKMREMDDNFRAKVTLLQQAEDELARTRNERPHTRMDQARYRATSILPQPDLTSFQPTINPLPQPPEPVIPDRLTTISRPYGQPHGRSPSEAASIPERTGSRMSTVRVRARSITTPDPLVAMAEEQDELRRDRSLRPQIVPGAPATQKVIPPPPTKESERDRRRRARSEVPRSDSSDSVHESSSSGPSRTNGSSAVTSASSGNGSGNSDSSMPVSYGYQYGFAPGHGYGWYPVQMPAMPPRSDTSADSSNIANGYHAPTSITSVFRNPTVEHVTRNRNGFTAPDSRGQEWGQNNGRLPGRVTSPSVAPPAVEPSEHSHATRNSNASSISGDSFQAMSLLGPPQGVQADERDQSDRREMLDLLGVTTSIHTSEPSPATTWGTMNSAEASSRNSTNPSLGDLGLIGLPSPMQDSPRDPLDDRDDSSDDGEIADDEFVTPRRQTLPYNEMGSLTERIQPAQPGQGLGLALGPNRAPTSQVLNGALIHGQQDLQRLNHSLLQLADREGQASRASHHGSRDPPVPVSGRETVEPILGARTGVPLYDSRPQSTRGIQGTPSSIHTSYSRARDRGSVSDTEHIYPRPSQHHTRRNSSISGHAVIPPAVVYNGYPNATPRRPSAAPRISDREVRFESPVGGPSHRERRGHAATPVTARASAADVNGFVPALGQSSLLLSFPTGPTNTSAAVDGRGEDAGIHAPAPRPVNSRNGSLFGLWNARSGR